MSTIELKKIIAGAKAALASLKAKNEENAPRNATPGGAYAAWTTKMAAEWAGVKEAYTAERVAAAEAGTLLYAAEDSAVKNGKHAAGEAYTVAGAKAGIHLVWISAQKKLRAAEYDAFVLEWNALHPKDAQAKKGVASRSASVASEAEVEAAVGFSVAGGGAAAGGQLVAPKVKRVPLEQKAALKAGREKAAAARKAARAAAEEVAPPAPANEVAPQNTVAPQKKVGRKKLEAMTPDERAKHDAAVAARRIAKKAKEDAKDAAKELSEADEVIFPSHPNSRPSSPGKLKAE